MAGEAQDVPSREVNSDDKVRQRSVFDWGKVPYPIVLRLLLAVYQESTSDLEEMSDVQLRAEAQATFRQLGSPTVLDRYPATWDVLRGAWLMREATTKQLAAVAAYLTLSLGPPANRVNRSNKAAMRRWFIQRNLTDTFKAALWREFRAAHQSRRTTKAGQGRGHSGAASGLRTISGENLPEPIPVYPHHLEAATALDRLARARSPEHRSGLVVLPTGAGKTTTAVRWLIGRMASDPQQRVLWLAHQEELLTQAADTFQKVARCQPESFHRKLRVVSSGHAPVTTMLDPNVDVAIVTWQSLIRRLQHSSSPLRSFCRRPTVVVIDEAHHAAAQGYQRILKEIHRQKDVILVGLTATPWPSGTSAASTLRRTFPTTVIDVSAEELHKRGILATPVIYTLDTHQSLDLTESELRLATSLDIPPDVLSRLRTEARNRLIVDTFKASPRKWGKSLVFATSTEHADDLGRLFRSEGIDARVLHSRIVDSRVDVLDWFRRHRGSCVLVSVGMLTEGVDVPDARTAFLARPTTSRILMRQMMGRVLRGPSAGGTSEANIVYLRDEWVNFDEVIEPGELPGLPTVHAKEPRNPTTRRLPPILDESGKTPVSDEVLAQLRRMYRQRTDSLPIAAATSRTRLAGYYVTLDRNVPVMQHQKPGFELLIQRSLHRKTFTGSPPASLFDDTYPPYPTLRSLNAVRSHIDSTGVRPDFIALSAPVDPRGIAKRLRKKGAMTDLARERYLLKQYEESLCRIAFPDFDSFEEAVEREIRELRQAARRGRNQCDPEQPSAPGRKSEVPFRRLRQSASRQLPALSGVVNQMHQLLEGEPALEGLHNENLPSVDWTRGRIQSAWAYWSLRMSGPAAGKPIIRVNRMLQAPHTQVSDDLLRYLLFHEMLHNILPGRGHDAEFRRLEAMWPNADQLDFELDTLHEQFDIDRIRR